MSDQATGAIAATSSHNPTKPGSTLPKASQMAFPPSDGIVVVVVVGAVVVVEGAVVVVEDAVVVVGHTGSQTCAVSASDDAPAIDAGTANAATANVIDKMIRILLRMISPSFFLPWRHAASLEATV